MNYNEWLNTLQSDKAKAELEYMETSDERKLFELTGIEIGLSKLYGGMMPFTNDGGVR